MGRLGDIQKITDANNQDSLTFTRDNQGRLTAITTNEGFTNTFQYNAAGKIASETNFVGLTTSYTYDNTNNYISTLTDDSGTRSFTFVNEQSTNRSNLLASETDQLGFLRTYNRDSLGRITSITLSRGSLSLTRSFEYLQPSVLRITEPDGRLATNYLGLNGSIVKTINDSGRTLNFVSDKENVTEYFNDSFLFRKTRDVNENTVSFTNPLNNNFKFSYNQEDNLSSLQEFSGNVTQFSYGSDGFLNSTIYPDGTKEGIATNTDGAITAFTDRDGSTVFIGYDVNGRMSSQTYANGTVVSYTYDNQDRILTVSSNGQTVTYSYAADQVSKIDYGAGKFVDYQYNPQGLRTRISTSAGLVQTYEYDDFLRLSAIRDGNNNPQAQYTYNAQGLVSRTTHGNGSFSAFTYNTDNLTTRIQHFKLEGTLLTQIDYQLDVFGNIAARTVREGNNEPQTTNFAYSPTGQLNLITLPDGNSIQYVYDANGNRVRTIRSNAATEESAFNILNQEVSSTGESFRYDKNGARVQKTDGSGITNYFYNALDQLVEVQSGNDVWTYEYDPLGNRKAVIKNGQRTDFLVDPFGNGTLSANILSQTTGGFTSHYFHGLVLESESDGTNTFSFNYDSIGNTVLVTDGSQNVINRYQYLPFGEISSKSETRANAFQFSGAYGVQNDGNGLNFMRARYYDAGNGTFTQADPIGFLGSLSNLYQYAVNNPLGYADPSGLTHCPPDSPPPLGPIQIPGPITELNVGASAYTLATDNPYIGLSKPFLASRDIDGINDTIKGFKKDIQDLKDFGVTSKDPLIKDLKDTNRILGNQIPGLESQAGRFSNSGKIFKGLDKGVTGIGYLSAINDAGKLVYRLNDPNSSTLDIIHDFGANANNALAYAGPIGKVASAGITVLDYVSDPEGPVNIFGIFAPQPQELLVRRPGFDPDEIDRKKKAKDCAHLEQINPSDPNDIVGPAGFGPGNSVELANLAYRVRFENKSDALAPAAEVFVTEVLDADLDLSTFRFTGAGFGSQSVTFNTPLTSVFARVDDRATSGLFVDITGNLNIATRTINWVFQSLDPTTLQVPANALIGFLPPNATSPQGEGFLTYTVSPNANSTNGTVVDALASIVFDGQPAIATPIYTNTIDTGAPTSAISALAATQSSLTFPVSWVGTDDAGNSGIATYDIFVSDNSGPFTLFKDDTTTTKADFTGLGGHTYFFKSIATDNLGFTQSDPGTQATTFINLPLETAAPRVLSISRAGSAVEAGAVQFTVTFTKPVTGVDLADFTAVTTGSVSTGPISVAGSGANYTVTINGVTGLGSVGLNLQDNSTIRDSANKPLYGKDAPVGLNTLPLIPIADGPEYVALGDVNGDGFLDFATSNLYSDNVSVVLGNGDGSFKGPQTFAVGNQAAVIDGPRSLLLADLNGDTALDIATANGRSLSVSVLLGNGNGIFKQQTQIPTESYNENILLGDFNGDGKQDLLTDSRTTKVLNLILGNGNGTFKSASDISITDSATGIAIGDLNKDSKLDIAVVSGFNPTKLRILLGNGDGSFSSGFETSLSGFTTGTKIGDINQDGFLDVGVANTGGTQLTIFLGNGDGTLQAGKSITAGKGPEYLVFGDMNGDGLIDIVNDNSQDDSISVHLGNGDGTFKTQVTFTAGDFPTGTNLGDFNNDGRLDIATSNIENDTVSTFLNTLKGNFTGDVYSVTATQNALSLSQSAAGAASDKAFTTQPVIRITDSAGSLVSTSTAAVTLGVSAGGTLIGNSTVNAVAGVATFTNAGIKGLVGNYTLTFTSQGLTSASQSNLALSAGSAAQISLTTPAAGAVNGSVFTTQPVVTLFDSAGNTAVGSNAAVSIGVSTGGTLTGTTTVQPTNGVVTFSNAGLKGLVGNYDLSYSAPGITSVGQTGLPLAIGPAAQLGIVTSASGAASGKPFTIQPVIAIQDIGENLVSTSAASVTLSTTKASTEGNATVAAVNGLATFVNAGLKGTVGAYTLNFQSSSLSQVQQTGLSLTFGDPVKLGILTNASGARNEKPFRVQPVLAIQDSANNTVTNSSATVLMAVSGGDSKGVVNGNVSVQISNGKAVYTNAGISGTEGATYTLVYTSSGLSVANQSAKISTNTVPLVTGTTPISGQDAKNPGSVVNLFDPTTGKPNGVAVPFPGFMGEVRVSAGDINGDGKAEIVAGAGPGGGPALNILDSETGASMSSFFAFAPEFRGGVYVNVNDVTGDGVADIIVGAGTGGGPHVKVFNGTDFQEIKSFFAYDNSFAGGVSVAAADIDGDNVMDIVTGAGPGGGPHVKVFNGATLGLIKEWFAFDASFRGGVFVAMGDLGGDGDFEVVTGAGPGGGPMVRIWNPFTAQMQAEFFAYELAFTGGVRVGLSDGNGDGVSDLVTGAGPGGGPHVKVFSGTTFELIDQFFSGSPEDTLGVFVS